MIATKLNPFTEFPYHSTVSKWGLLVICLFVSQLSHATLTVTDGGFQELPNAALADGGTVKTTFDYWWDDEPDSATISYSSFILHYTGDVGSTQLLAMGKNQGYIYQSLGTRALGEDSLTVTLDAFERTGSTDRFFPTLNIDIYAGSFGGAGNGVDIDDTLTSIGTLSVTGSDLFTTPTDGSDGESRLGFTVSGSVDLSGVAVGTEIWIRFQTPDATGNTSAVYVDNISVTTTANAQPLVITDGGFQELPNSALADGGTVKTTFDYWWDDEPDSSTVSYSSFILHYTGDVGSTQLLALGKNQGYIYQSLGTRTLGADSLSVTLDAFERTGSTDRFFPTLNIDIYAGSFGGAANGVDIDDTLTSIGTLTVTGSDLFTTPTDGSDGESQLGFTVPGSIDLTGVAVGTEIWIRFQTPDATGNTSAVYIDNVSVTTSASSQGFTYADPFPAPTTVGEASQDAGNILYSESFTDQTTGSSNDVLGISGEYWAGETPLSRALPTSMEDGLEKMSVEFWLKVADGENVGYSRFDNPRISMPGFTLTTTNEYSKTPHGILAMKFYTTKDGNPLNAMKGLIGIIADGQWHHYAATCDGDTSSFYQDGELVSQDWLGNGADLIGPQIFDSGDTIEITNVSYGYTVAGEGSIDEVRVSNVALTPWEVRRNYENYREYTNTYYVSTTGLSSNSGSEVSPWDLATALDEVGADTKIILAAGTYDGAGFEVTDSGGSALHSALITGADGSDPVIIQTTGSGTGPTLTGTEYLRLRNLTFESDLQPGLTVSGGGIGNIIDGCRLSSNVDALSVVDSSGLHDPNANRHFIIVPGVLLENSVLAAGNSSAGVRYDETEVIVARNNTFVGGQYGAYFKNGSINVTLLNNLFDGQTGANVYFDSNSLLDIDGNGRLPGYMGDGNVYNPAEGGYLATVIDNEPPRFDPPEDNPNPYSGTTHFSTINDFSEYWYLKQYAVAADALPRAKAKIFSGYRNDQRSVMGTPIYIDGSNDDYRLAAVAPNVIDTGADQIFNRKVISTSPSVWDGQGNIRSQGNAVDAGAYETNGSVSATFTLSTEATTSAGVYDSNDRLVKTLWRGNVEPAGDITAYWNGLDDNGNVMSDGDYSIKLLANNVEYVWDGAMSNSDPLVGPDVQHNFNIIFSMVTVGDDAYYTSGYNEGGHQLIKLDLSAPRRVEARGVSEMKETEGLIKYIATDGTSLFALYQDYLDNDPNNGKNDGETYIVKYDLDFNEDPMGEVLVGTNTNSKGSAGIAVQPDGYQDLLFVSHSADNKIYLLDKGDFSAYSTAYLDGGAEDWDSLGAIAATDDGDLWIICKSTAAPNAGDWQILRYTNFGGTPTLAVTVTGGFVNPIGIAVSIDGNNTLMIADGESGSTVQQQIKAYSPTGTSLWTLGQAGGYASNGPAITNDKFILDGMICPVSDGSFWITDRASSNRTMHFSSSRTFIEDILYDRSYLISGDENDPTRVFKNFVEYEVDYSEDYLQNEGWTPKNNWSYVNGENVTTGPDIWVFGRYGIVQAATLSNNRTYAMISKEVFTKDHDDEHAYAIVELTSNGIRDTGLRPDTGYWLQSDGSLISSTYINNDTEVEYRSLALTGFDVDGNPEYDDPEVLLTTADNTSNDYWYGVTPAASGGRVAPAPAYQVLDNGLLAVYAPHANAGGMHLGAVDPSTGDWAWQTMPAGGKLNGKGNFDTDNWYGGNRVMVSGSNVFAGYHGEAWRSVGQAGIFTHYDEEGLFIGQFGIPWRSSPEIYGSAGNALTPFVRAHGNNIYLYANDEWSRNMQRWTLTGLDTIQTYNATVSLEAAMESSFMMAGGSSSATSESENSMSGSTAYFAAAGSGTKTVSDRFDIPLTLVSLLDPYEPNDYDDPFDITLNLLMWNPIRLSDIDGLSAINSVEDHDYFEVFLYPGWYEAEIQFDLVDSWSPVSVSLYDSDGKGVGSVQNEGLDSLFIYRILYVPESGYYTIGVHPQEAPDFPEVDYPVRYDLEFKFFEW